MSARFAALFVLALTPLAAAQTYDGALGPGDDQLPSGEYADVYTVDVAAGGVVEATLTSSAFDTYLVVVAPDGTQEENDDDGSTSRSALRVPSAAGGTHQVVVTSYAAAEAGTYRLVVTTGGGATLPVTKGRRTPAAPPSASATPPAPTPRPATAPAARPAAAPRTRSACVTPPPATRRRLHAQGVVTDCAGRPLAGVEVRISGVTAAGERVGMSAVTDGQGRYATRVPDGFYRVAAEHTVQWQGRPAGFALAPADGDDEQQDAAAGIAENLVWRLSGLRPGETAGVEGAYGEAQKYYGAQIQVTSEEHGFSGLYFPAGSTLAVTLTPAGPLVDGSAGAPLTFTKAFDRDATSSIHWYLTDVPVGPYALAATLTLPDGTPEAVGSKPSLAFSAPFAPATDVRFVPGSFGDIDMLQVTLQTRDRSGD
ncbi:hypothetical protein [Rubrivirga marina]|uniref:Carboxypeptidase regulatory-like domain-containing protein n=1 Tax=Rubrivirga marina TaxID=1196024 RepID=A0A271J658_9BACT|nr:hypothetical protein [Rubrivirga marina]PAP78139.1 hypothetical protein BSZ37_17710 [Rubrivirga marina]